MGMLSQLCQGRFTVPTCLGKSQLQPQAFTSATGRHHPAGYGQDSRGVFSLSIHSNRRAQQLSGARAMHGFATTSDITDLLGWNHFELGLTIASTGSTRVMITKSALDQAS